jgi:hypothetical protein
MSEFATEAGTPVEIKPKILCVGDSLTAGYHFWGSEWFPYADTLTALLEERYIVDHIGYSGWTTEQMLYSAHKELTYDVCDRKWPGIDVKLNRNGSYEYAFLLAGTNDLSRSDANSIVANLQTLTYKFLTHGSFVGLLTVPTLGAEKSLAHIRAVRVAVNEGIQSLVQSNPTRLFLVDTSAALPQIEEDAESMLLWDSDKLHLSEKGSQTIAKTVFAAMQTFKLELPDLIAKVNADNERNESS